MLDKPAASICRIEESSASIYHNTKCHNGRWYFHSDWHGTRHPPTPKKTQINITGKIMEESMFKCLTLVRKFHINNHIYSIYLRQCRGSRFLYQSHTVSLNVLTCWNWCQDSVHIQTAFLQCFVWERYIRRHLPEDLRLAVDWSSAYDSCAEQAVVLVLSVA